MKMNLSASAMLMLWKYTKIKGWTGIITDADREGRGAANVRKKKFIYNKKSVKYSKSRQTSVFTWKKSLKNN